MAEKIKKQYGNFVLTHDEKKGYVTVKAVSGYWQLKFRNDHAMFGALLRFADDKEMDRYFEHLFGLWHIFCHGLPDGKCLDDVVKAFEGWFERLREAERVKEVTKEEEEKIISEVATGEEMREEALKELEDGSKDKE